MPSNSAIAATESVETGVEKPGQILRGLVAVICAIALTILVTLFRTQLLQYQTYGYFGIVFACFIANSTVFLPAPSSAIVMNFGAIYHPFWVGIAGGVGAALGDCVGYIAGLGGKSLISKSKLLDYFGQMLSNKGWVTIFIFAFLPLPLFDILGVLAGATGMRWTKFLSAVLLGKVLKMLVYSYAGAGLLPFLIPYILSIINR